MNAHGFVHKYGDNVDTDVIIPARYLTTSVPSELAAHCMEDIDREFIHKVKPGDIMVADKNFGCGSSREHALSPSRRRESLWSSPPLLPGFFTETLSISACRLWNVGKPPGISRPATR